MFSDYSRDLLRSGIIEAKAGNRGSARRYLDRAVYMSNDHDVMAEAWYWLSKVAENAAAKREALENCLANDLDHARARRELAILDGRLKENEIIDPEALPPAPLGVRATETQRFMCPRCGGRMAYAPDGGSLVCEYCLRHEATESEVLNQTGHDFIAAMATEGAHRRPLREQIAHCQGCGAEFIIPARELSFECAYCGSPHVVNTRRSRDLVAPDRILPHAFDQGHAKGLLGEWINKAKIVPDPPVGPPRGLYLPVWTFLLGGRVDYTAEQACREVEWGLWPGAAGQAHQRQRCGSDGSSCCSKQQAIGTVCAVNPNVRHARAETCTMRGCS